MPKDPIDYIGNLISPQAQIKSFEPAPENRVDQFLRWLIEAGKLAMPTGVYLQAPSQPRWEDIDPNTGNGSLILGEIPLKLNPGQTQQYLSKAFLDPHLSKFFTDEKLVDRMEQLGVSEKVPDVLAEVMHKFPELSGKDLFDKAKGFLTQMSKFSKDALRRGVEVSGAAELSQAQALEQQLAAAGRVVESGQGGLLNLPELTVEMSKRNIKAALARLGTPVPENLSDAEALSLFIANNHPNPNTRLFVRNIPSFSEGKGWESETTSLGRGRARATNPADPDRKMFTENPSGWFDKVFKESVEFVKNPTVNTTKFNNYMGNQPYNKVVQAIKNNVPKDQQEIVTRNILQKQPFSKLNYEYGFDTSVVKQHYSKIFNELADQAVKIDEPPDLPGWPEWLRRKK